MTAMGCILAYFFFFIISLKFLFMNSFPLATTTTTTTIKSSMLFFVFFFNLFIFALKDFHINLCKRHPAGVLYQDDNILNWKLFNIEIIKFWLRVRTSTSLIWNVALNLEGPKSPYKVIVDDAITVFIYIYFSISFFILQIWNNIKTLMKKNRKRSLLTWIIIKVVQNGASKC